jgi:hypothetical protein
MSPYTAELKNEWNYSTSIGIIPPAYFPGVAVSISK